jgi:hypothetical protein
VTFLSVLCVAGLSTAADQYIGRLRPELVPTRIVYVKLKALTPDERQHLPQSVSDGDCAFGESSTGHFQGRTEACAVLEKAFELC